MFALNQRRLERLTGTVTDPSSVVVQNAKITLRNYGTTETLTAITNQDGLYRFSLLAPGEYELTVEAVGLGAARSARGDDSVYRIWNIRNFGSTGKSC